MSDRKFGNKFCSSPCLGNSWC